MPKRSFAGNNTSKECRSLNSMSSRGSRGVLFWIEVEGNTRVRGNAMGWYPELWEGGAGKYVGYRGKKERLIGKPGRSKIIPGVV